MLRAHGRIFAKLSFRQATAEDGIDALEDERRDQGDAQRLHAQPRVHQADKTGEEQHDAAGQRPAPAPRPPARCRSTAETMRETPENSSQKANRSGSDSSVKASLKRKKQRQQHRENAVQPAARPNGKTADGRGRRGRSGYAALDCISPADSTAVSWLHRQTTPAQSATRPAITLKTRIVPLRIRNAPFQICAIPGPSVRDRYSPFAPGFPAKFLYFHKNFIQ